MVGLGIVRRNSKDIMRRSKTSVQIKQNAPRRSSLQMKTPYFWNAGGANQDTPRGSQTARADVSNRGNYRRKSIDCTYHIWDLTDVSEGMNNIKLIQMPDETRDGMRKANPIFPPIPTKSLRNPRLLSAKSSSRSEKSPPKKNRTGSYDLSDGLDDHSANISTGLLASERSTTENFTHGLPDDAQRYSSETTSIQRSQTTFSFGSKASDPASHRSPNARATKLKASSLHSRSSEGSCNSAAFRAKLASRRRQSLPATPTSLVPAKSREFHKAFKELSRQADDTNIGMRGSQTATSLKTMSDKVSSTAPTNAPRDGLVMKANARKDSLHRIEEIPSEQPGTPMFTVNEETKDDHDVPDNGGKYCHENGYVIHNGDLTPKAVDIDVTAEDSVRHKIGRGSTAAEHSHKLSSNDDIAENVPGNTASQDSDRQAQDDAKNVVALSKKALTAIKKTVPAKPEILVNSFTIEDDDSVIDASILNERDEDLCDTDFREKRIIQWIISAETGDRVEQLVESAVSPSPTNGSRETAITVIYDG